MDDDALRTVEKEFLEAFDCLADGDYDRAAELLTRVVAFDPGHHEAFEGLIDAHFGAGRLRRVIQLADEGVAAGRPAAPLLGWKSLAHVAMEELPEAEKAARAAVAADPALDTAVVTLSTVLVRRGSTDAALDVCRQFIDDHPDNDTVALQRIDIASQIEEHQLVIDSARDYLARFEPDAHVLHLLGLAHLDLQDERKAELAFREALSLEPDEIEYHVSLVMMWILHGQDAKATRHVEKLGKRDPELAAAVDDEVDRLFEEFEAAKRETPDA